MFAANVLQIAVPAGNPGGVTGLADFAREDLLLVVEFLQIAVGLTQARTGLPVGLVGTHMVLAGLLVGATTAVVLATRASAGRAAVREPLDA